jgi:hypothetical protein
MFNPALNSELLVSPENVLSVNVNDAQNVPIYNALPELLNPVFIMSVSDIDTIGAFPEMNDYPANVYGVLVLVLFPNALFSIISFRPERSISYYLA